MKIFGGLKAATRLWRHNRQKRGMVVVGPRKVSFFTLRRLFSWMSRSVRGAYGSLMTMPVGVEAVASSRRTSRRGMLEAVRASMELLEPRTLLSANIIYVNDNWRVHVGGPTAGTLENTGLHDDKSITGLTLGTNAFNSLSSALLSASATPGTTIVVVSGSYNATTEPAATITTSGLTIEGWSYFTAHTTVANNPDIAHVDPTKFDPTLSSTLDTAVYTVNGANETVEGFLVTDAGTAGGIVVGSGATNYTVASNTFDTNGTGLVVNGGSGTVTSNTFTNNSVAISVTGGTVSVGANSLDSSGAVGVDVTGGNVTISGTTFAADLATYISNESGNVVSAVGNTFGAVNTGIAETSLAQFYAIEDKISDNLDLPGDGFVKLDPTNVYVSQLSDTTTAGSIQRGVDDAVSGGTVNVEAGTYVGNGTVDGTDGFVSGVLINKPLTLLGTNSGFDPKVSTTPANDQVVLLPGTSDPSFDINESAGIEITSSGVTVEGFTIDGSNTVTPGFVHNGGVTYNGVPIDQAVGVVSARGVGNVTVQGNIIENADYAGVDLENDDNGGAATSDNVIDDNLIEHLSDNLGFGVGVILANNSYAQVDNNDMLDLRVGVQTNNFSNANNDALFAPTISGNDIASNHLDIFFNLMYDTTSTFTIANNDLTASLTSTTTPWEGVRITSIQSNVSVDLENNTIDGSAAADSPNVSAGIVVWNTPTTGNITINGGSITGVDYGVWVNSFEGFNSAGDATHATVTGVAISARQIGVYVEDSAANTAHPAVSAVLSGDTITGSTTGVEVSGAHASATIGNVTIHDPATTGILVTGGSAAITGASIYGDTTGIEYTAGGSGSVTGVDFDNATAGPANTSTDLLIDSTAGTVVDGGSNLFAGATFIQDLVAGLTVDASGDTFAGIAAAGFTLAQAYATEDRIEDYLDTPSDGYVKLSGTDVYVSQLSETTTAGAVQRGVNEAVSGNTVDVEAGTFAGGVVVSTPLTLAGAGSTTAGTVISVSSGNGIEVAAGNVTLSGVRVVGNASTNGIYFNSTTANTSLSNVVSTGSGTDLEIHNNAVLTNLSLDQVSLIGGTDGFRVATTGTVNGLTITNSHFDNDSIGFYTNGDSSSTANQHGFTNVSISSSTFNNDASKGIYVEKLDHATLDGITVDNSGTAAASPNGVDLNLKYGTYTSITIENSNFDSDATGNASFGALDIEGRNDAPTYNTNPASLSGVTLENDTFTGTSPVDLVIANNVTGVSMSGMVLGGTGAGLLSQDTAGGLNVGNTSFGGTLSEYIVNETPFGIDATNGATFNGFDTGAGTAAASTPTYDAIEDKIVDGVDIGGLGLVRVLAGNVFVTPNSFVVAGGTSTASVQRAVNVASAGDTVNIAAGSYTGGLDTSSKGLTLSLGATPESVSIAGNVTLYGGDTLDVLIDGTGAGAFDHVTATGTVSLGGAVLNTHGSTIVATQGQSVQIISGGTVTGQFAGIPSNSVINLNGQPFEVFYNGNNVTVTRLSDAVIPPANPGDPATPLGAPTVVYVDDGWTGLSAGTDADGATGAGLGNGTAIGYDEFADIQDAINAVAVNGTVEVYAGTYAQDLTINKKISLESAESEVAVGSRSEGSGLEAIITSPTADTGTGASDLLNITASGVVVDGFVFDGSADGGGAHNAIATTDASGNGQAVNGTVIENNFIQNVGHDGVGIINPSNGSAVTSGTVVTGNQISGFGDYGVILAYNAYGEVSSNTITMPDFAEAGVWVYDFTANGATAATQTVNVTNNMVTAGEDDFGGIWANLLYPSDMTLNIAGNTVNAGAGVTGTDGYTNGIYLTTLQNGVSATLTDNTVGNAGGQFATGISLWNLPTTAVSVSGGSVGHSVTGIAVDNDDVNFGDAGAASSVSISGETIVADGGAGIFVGGDATGGAVSASILNNSITSNVDGIDVTGTGNATIGDGTVGNENRIHALVTGISVQDGTATVDENLLNNPFSGGGTGLKIAGSATAAVDNNTFDAFGAAFGTDVVIDGGTISSLTDNSFAGTTEFIDNSSTNAIDARTDTFDVSGTQIAGSGLSVADAYGVEDKITDYLDKPADGYVELNASNVYVTQVSENTTSDAIERGVTVANATTNATVHIEDGNYKAAATITAPMTIEGDSETGVKVTPLTGGGASQVAFLIESSGVTIQDLTIDGRKSSSADQFMFGVFTQYTATQFLGINPVVYNDLTAEDLTVKNTNDRGIEFKNQGSGYTIDDNTVTDAGDGIAIFGGSGSIIGNVISDTTGANFDSGIVSNALYDALNNEFSAVLTIQGNTITGEDFGMFLSATGTGTLIGGDLASEANIIDTTAAGPADGIALTFAGGSNTIEGNSITTDNNSYGVYLFNDGTAPTNILGNTISAGTGGTGDVGIYNVDTDSGESAIGGSNANVQGNAISNYAFGVAFEADSHGTVVTGNIGGTLANTITGDAGSTGIWLGGPGVSATVSGNDIASNATGIDVEQGAVATITGNTFSTNGLDLLAASGATISSLTDNAFTGTQFIDNEAAGGIDASTDTFNVGGTQIPGSGLTVANAYGVEDKITDYLDKPGVGYVELNSTQVFVSQLSDTTTHGAVQRGVDVASLGGTVNIQAGTFIGQVVIPENLTLLGASEAGTVIQAPALMATSFNDGFQNTPVVLVENSGDVTIQDLTVDGAGQGNAYPDAFEGVAFDNAGGTVDHVTIKGVRDNPLDGDQGGFGLYGSVSGSTPETLNVTDSTIEDYQKEGIDLYAPGATLTADIDGNVITGAGPTALIAQNGIEIDEGVNVTINDNTISGDSYTPATTNSAGILLFSSGNVTNNKISGTDIGVYAAGTTGTVDITGNTITGSTTAAVSADDGTYVISDNTLTGGTGDGVDLYDAQNGTTVHNNLIGGNGADGVYVDSSVTDSSGPLTVNDNSIAGNGVGLENESSVAVDATNNWWGSANGPTATGNTFNKGHQGDAITGSGAVNFAPWLTSGVNNAAVGVAGFVPDANVSFAPVTDVTPGHEGGFASIQAAVNAAHDGDTLDVAAGTYTENVDVTKGVKIIGAGQGSTTVYSAVSSTGGGSLSNAIFLVDANDVMIHNLTVDGDNPLNGAGIDANAGIISNWDRPDSLTGMTITDVTVQNIYLRGIEYSNGDSGTGSVDIEDDTVTNVKGDPENSIAIFSFGGSGIIAGNTISDTPAAISTNWSFGTEISGNIISDAGTGIHSDNNGGEGGTGDSIHNNTITVGSAGSYGIFAFAPYATVSIANNTISGVDVGLAALGGAGGSAAFSDNSVTVNAGGTGALVTTDQGEFGQADVVASFDGDSFKGGDTGIDVEQNAGATASATITDVTIGDPTEFAILVHGGSAAISGGHISDNPVGIEFTGGGSGSVAGVNFAGTSPTTNNGTDLVLTSDAGTVSVGNNNAFAGNVSIEDQSSQTIDLSGTTGNTFDGVHLNNATLSQLYTIEDNVIDAIDKTGYGLVRLKAGNLYVTPNSFVAPAATDDTGVIERAVKLASDGDTVNIKAGTYHETQVKITQGLTLSGAGEGLTIIDGGGEGNIVPISGTILVTGTTALQAVTLEGFTVQNAGTPQDAAVPGSGDPIGAVDATHVAGNVTIEHLQIIGENDATAFDSGIIVFATDTTSTLVIENNDLSKMFQGVLVEDALGQDQILGNTIHDLVSGNFDSTDVPAEGIFVLTDSGLNDTSSVQVNGNTLEDYTGYGIIVQGGYTGAGAGADTNVEVEDNMISSVGDDAPGIGIYNGGDSPASGVSGATISGNQISGTNTAGADGIDIYGSNSDITVFGNSITDTDTGIQLSGDATAGVPSVEISSNTITGSTVAGVDIQAGDATVYRNTLSHDGDGVIVRSGAELDSASQNFVENNSVGIELKSGATSGGINDNSITGNGHAGLENDSSATVDATNNWWGSANGPTTPLNTFATSGTGDAVIGSAEIAPWLTDGTDQQPGTPGFQPTPSTGVPVATATPEAGNNNDEGSSQSYDVVVTGTTDEVTYYWTVTKNGNAYAASSTVQTASLSDTFSFTPNDNGAYVVTVTVVDQDGNSDTTADDVAIANVAPTAGLSVVTNPGVEGSAESLTASATDPSTLDAAVGFTYNWTITKQHGAGPATVYLSGSSAGATAPINFTPDDDGTYVVSVTATDKDGGISAVATDTLTIANVAPTAALSVVTDPGLEGSGESLTASATDPSTPDTAAGFTYNWTITKQRGSDPATVYLSSSGAGATVPINFTPDDDGTYVVSVTATDKDGGVSAAVTDTLTIANVNPTATITGTPTSPVNEGSPITLGSHVTDPSTVDTGAGFTYSWSVTKNGLPFALSLPHAAASYTFTPDDNGTYVVTLTATDKDGGSDTVSSSNITVANVAPSGLSMSATSPINENSSTSLSGSFTDPGSADNHTLTINWGDGTIANPDIQTVNLDPGVTSFSGIPHQYLDNLPGNAPYTVSVSVADKDGGTTSSSTTVTVLDVAPMIDLSASATTTPEGAVYTLDLGAITDPGTLDPVTGYAINWGDGEVDNFIGGGSPANTTKTHTYADGPANEQVSVTLLDKDGFFTGAGILNLTVQNVAPTAVFNNFGTVNEGAGNTVIFTGASDPSAADTAAGFHYAYDFNDDGIFNDGAGDGTYAGSAAEGSSIAVPGSFLATPGPHTVHARIIDRDGGFTDYTTTFNVNNVAPIVNLPSSATASAGIVFNSSGSFTDSSSDTPWTGMVNYGDGAGFQPLTVDSVHKTFNLSHTYTTVGNYTVTVKITDSTGFVTPVQFAPMTGTNTMAVNVQATTLRVTSATATGDGFDLTFNRAIQASDIALFGSGSVVSPITVDDGSTPVSGSLVWDSTTNTAHWIKTGGNLANGTYTITLTSGTSGDTFHDTTGGALDGNSDNVAGDNYTDIVNVSNPVVLSIPNFARGPGQSVLVNQNGIQTGATGLPITLSSGTGVQSVHFVLNYDPTLLTIDTSPANITIPAGNWAYNINTSTPGHLDIVVFATGPNTLADEGSGPQTVITFNDVTVPSTAPTGAAEAITFSSVLINEGLTNPIASIGAEAVHKVVDLGDTTDSGIVGSKDAFNISRVVVHLDTGFAKDPLTDPVIIADLTGDGTLSGLDATDASLMATIPGSQTQVPTPVKIVGGAISGLDPTVETGLGSLTTINTTVGSSVTANVQISDNANGLSSADLQITYDPTLLTLSDANVQISSALHALGWAMTEAVISPGTLNVGLFAAGSNPQPLTTTGAESLLNLTFHAKTTDGVSQLGVGPDEGGGLNGGSLPMSTNVGSITINSALTGEHVFYAGSIFDVDNGDGVNPDDNAIATDKTALLYGQTATFANYTSYTDGINGIMIDIAGTVGTLTASDFSFSVGGVGSNGNDLSTWTTLLTNPSNLTITQRPTPGVPGSTRVTLLFANNLIQNEWLQVNVLKTANTGLAAASTFFFGNAIGETGDSTTDAKVTATDEIGARSNTVNFLGASITDPYDFNRDGNVNAVDEIYARSNVTTSFTALDLITPEPSSPETPGFSFAAAVVTTGSEAVVPAVAGSQVTADVVPVESVAVASSPAVQPVVAATAAPKKSTGAGASKKKAKKVIQVKPAAKPPTKKVSRTSSVAPFIKKVKKTGDDSLDPGDGAS